MDEDYEPTLTRCGVGACAAEGQTTCADGQISDSCATTAPALSDETCDGVDEDCDGVEDEDYEIRQTQCGIGVCAAEGQTLCVAGVVEDSCMEAPPAENDETCNGLDDDCDDRIDEHYLARETSCGIGGCQSNGLTTCQDGVETDNCVANEADLERCGDRLDNDCDGQTDEGFETLGNVCTAGVNACRTEGILICSVDALELTLLAMI